MNNDIYKKIWEKITLNNKITLFTHVNPDGDTLGSARALKELILSNTEGKEVKISGDKAPYNLDFLKVRDEVSDKFIEESLGIIIDAPSVKRTFDKRVLNAKEILKIDHHHEEEGPWSAAVEGDYYPATGEILYELATELSLKVNKEAAEGIFVSIWTDTSGLIEREPTENTFKAVEWSIELGANKEDLIEKMKLSDEHIKLIEKLIGNATIDNGFVYKINDEEVPLDIYRPSTEEFVKAYDEQIYLYASIVKEGYRVGFRSKSFDVSKVAEKFNGGGHKLSSGTFVKSREEVIEIINYIKERNNG